MNERPIPEPDDDEALGSLLRGAGSRAQPPESVAREVRAAVEAEWRSVVRGRTVTPIRPSRRRFTGGVLALAEGVGALAIGLRLLPSTSPPGPVVARVDRTVGGVELGSDGSGWQSPAAGGAIRQGQEFRTGPGGRAAVRFPGGASLRLDAGTTVAFEAPDRLALRAGAVYLDSGASSPVPGPGLVVATRFGTVRHLGTQYEVRVQPADLLVSVREGSVAVSGSATDSAAGPSEAGAGEQLRVDGAGRISRVPLPPGGKAWAWIGSITPTYAIEQRPLPEFLAWVARETGRQLEFASADARAQAAGVTLRGSIEGLAPDAALAAVLATTRLQATTRDDRIVVELNSTP